jgi:hypothetical protein
MLGVVGVAAIGVGWQFGTATAPTGAVTVAPGTLVFPGLAAKLQGAKTIEILHQGQKLVLVQANGKWGIADRGGFPVQQDRLRELLTGLTELRITEARTSDPEQLARLGVEDPLPATANSNLLKVVDGSGGVLAELVVGHRRVRTQGNVPESIYIRRPAEAQAWLAEGRLPVDADPQLWFERDIANINHDKIASVHVVRGETTLDFAREGDRLVLTAPAEHPKLDEYRVEEVGRALEMLTLSDVKPASQQPGEKLGTAEITTTDGMKITAQVFKTEKDIWAQFAATGAGDAAGPAGVFQARVAGWAYQIGSWKEKSLVPMLADLKAEEPEAPPPKPAP